MNQQKTTTPLAGQIVRVADVTTSHRDEMYRLMCQYYDNLSRDTFNRDFEEKDWVIVASNPEDGRIRGFSTQQLIDVDDQKGNLPRARKVLFSGDTIIDRAWWGRNPLAQLWGRLSLTLLDEHPDSDLFWFLISKGYKTYRFLPVFFFEFYPRFESPTPDWATELIRQVAGRRYPGRFDPDQGIVRADPAGGQLRSGVADLTTERLENKHVEFFDQRNPGHRRGDELCCIAPITRENFKPGAYRVIGEQTAVRL